MSLSMTDKKTKIIAVILLLVLIFSLPFILPSNSSAPKQLATTNTTINNSVSITFNQSLPTLPVNNSSVTLDNKFEPQSTISSNITYSVMRVNNHTFMITLSIPVNNPSKNETITLKTDDPTVELITTSGEVVKELSEKVNGYGALFKFYMTLNEEFSIKEKNVLLNVELLRNDTPIDMTIITIKLPE